MRIAYRYAGGVRTQRGGAGVGTPIRVMLVGEYRVALFGLDRLINERRPAMEIVATATSCTLACTLAGQILPHVVVIDPEHGCENVGEIIPTLVADYGARVLMLVGQRDQSIRESFVLRGASGVVQKDEAPETLLNNKSLATSLHIGEHTLRNHLSRIYDKLDVPNRVELYVFATRNGLTT